MVLAQYKAWCTRRLKKHRIAMTETPLLKKWWTREGSEQPLYTEKTVKAAIRYGFEYLGD